jgi:hypothetical protein
MTETFADAVDRLRDVLREQVSGWSRLLESTRASSRAVRRQDPGEFERLLAEQVETLRELREVDRRRALLVREVGLPAGDGGLSELQSELDRLAAEVSRGTRIARLVIERNGEMVEARLALRRRAGLDPGRAASRVDHVA